MTPLLISLIPQNQPSFIFSFVSFVLFSSPIFSLIFSFVLLNNMRHIKRQLQITMQQNNDLGHPMKRKKKKEMRTFLWLFS